jgi:Na+-transporting methylmalonyl-CoA/oxaloacetate decarboxylase beta subunit
MTDELIRSLRSDWQSQEYDATHVIRRLRRARWTPHFVFALEILGCAVALVVGIWFAWLAVHQSEDRLLLALSAAVLLIAVPVLGIATAVARRTGFAWADETPESILRIGIRRADASLRAMRVGRWHLAAVAGFVVLLWVLQLLELIGALEFLVFYTWVCLAVSLVSGIWMAWRIRAVRAERDACIQLLAALQE